jgi:crotonobetainyl-CoA:carnitine CoA-transferase CaiB-like acyl-CoA transferase
MVPFQDGAARTVSPSKGQHGVAILTEHGYSGSEIARLLEAGVLATG